MKITDLTPALEASEVSVVSELSGPLTGLTELTVPTTSDVVSGGVLAIERVQILPPVKAWATPLSCQGLARFVIEHGPLICLKLRMERRWSQIDDALREVVGAEHHRPPSERGFWVLYQRAWFLTKKAHLPAIVDRLSDLRGLDYLTVRDAPNALTCDHSLCVARRTPTDPTAPKPPRGRRPRHPVQVDHVGPHALYRFFDAAGTLLYVGITKDLGARWYSHDRGKPWWTYVASATVEHFDSRDEALAAETEAIRQEGPLWNITHNS